MCNFFAQADALATGKTSVELRAENVPDSKVPHKTFTGNRPSTSILLPELNAYTVGQVLALYEKPHCRTGGHAEDEPSTALTNDFNPIHCKTPVNFRTVSDSR